MEKKKIIIPVILVLLVFGYFFWGYVVSKTSENVISASGTIEATEIAVGTKVGGTILNLYIADSSVVSRDALIAQIDVPELTAQINAAKAAFAMAVVKRSQADEDLKRIASLFEQEMVSASQYDAAKTLASTAWSAADQSKAGIDLLQVQIDNAKIKSPVAGTVIVKAVEQGELVAAGSTIATIADLSTLNLKIYVGEKLAGRISLGDTVSVNVDSYSGRNFPGKVVNISQKAEFTPKNVQTKEERVNLVFAIKVEIPNPGLILKPGMPADAAINLPKQ